MTQRHANGLTEKSQRTETLGMLNLVREINDKTKHLTRGKITTCSDNKNVINGVLNEIDKLSKCTQEASATVEAIKI